MGGGFEYEATHVSELIIRGDVSSPIIRADTSRKVIAIMEQSLKEQGFSRLLKKNN